jgi:glycosyltransferase involved in cell wall biosynthesis
MEINIITRCTRIDNLYKVKESIFNNQNFIINWYVIFDTSVIKEIDGDVLSMLYQNNCNIRFVNGQSGDFGHQLINMCIDDIKSGFVYVLDDDNIIHENFYDTLYEYITNNPDKKGFIFNQKVGGVDFSGLDIRIASPENTKVQSIDMSQFILSRDLIGENRLGVMNYMADGIFIENLFNENKDDFIFINEILCYYNKLSKKKNNSLPRVLVVGLEEPVTLNSSFIADFESTELNTLTIKDDSNIDEVIQSFNPDSIITICENFSKFPKLSHHSLDVRGRWLHFNSIDGVGDPSYQCASGYILGDYDPNTPLISFFTPIYNTGDKLWRTYESVRNQDYTNWEWVMVNDSNDGGKTLKVAEEISKRDCRVKVYDFKKKSGGIVGESKYRAASLSNGKYIMELDHDDCLTPDAGRLMVDAFKMYPDAKFVYSDCVEVDENYNSLTYGEGFAFGYGSYREEQFAGRTYKVANCPNINPKTIRHIVGVPNHFRAWDRVFYHSIGGHNRRLTIADDYELIVRTFLNTRMIRIPKMLYLQFYHNSNTQDSSRKDIQRRVRSISNHYNQKIKDRFVQLGFKDWAYESNPGNPLMCESRFNEQEGYVNYIMGLDKKVEYNFEALNSVPMLNT